MSYLLLSTLATVLFFGAYWLLMRRETRFAMRRFYLLGTLLLSLLLPLVHLPLSIPLGTPVAQRLMPAEELPSVEESALPLGTPSTTQSQTATYYKELPSAFGEGYASPSGWDYLLTGLGIVYWVGFAVMLVLLAVRLLRLRSRLRQLPYRVEDGIRVSLLPDDTPAFSFGRHIVVGTKGFSLQEVKQLVGHERVHVRDLHSLDILFGQLVKVMLWFNPFVWLYVREMKRVHEFIADSTMLGSEQGADYAQLFYHQVSGRPYSPLANTFDYSMSRSRIAMMARRRSRRGWMLPLVALPIVAVMLLAGCASTNTLKGFYQVTGMALQSDNPEEPTLHCSEFIGLENRIFAFHRDGQLQIFLRNDLDQKELASYRIDDNGLHLYDSNGNPWLNMMLETLHCDGDSIVLRFVDADPLGGLGKMLTGLSDGSYRIDTVEVSSTTRADGDEIIEVYEGKQVDTVFAQVVVPSPKDSLYTYSTGNRLLGAATDGQTTYGSKVRTALGKTKVETGTLWEFRNNALVPDARQRYDTTGYFNPRMEGDRFILQVTLRRVKKAGTLWNR